MNKPPINFAIANNNLKNSKILSLTKVYKKRFKINKINFRKNIKDKEVLIAGVGPGREILFINELNPSSIKAIDLSPINIQRAKKFTKKLIREKKKISFECQNIESLPYDDNSFDHVFSYGVIHHASNTDLCFTELNRVLKKNGTMFIFLYGSSGIYFYLIRHIRKMVRKLNSKEILKYSNKIINIDPMLTYHFLDDWKADYLRTFTHKDLIRRASALGLSKVKSLNRGMIYDVIERKNRFRKDKEWMGEGELRYIFKKTSLKKTNKIHKLPNNSIGSKDEYSKKILDTYEPLFKSIHKICNELDNSKVFHISYLLHKQLLKSMRSSREFNNKPIINILNRFIKDHSD